jgi:hypothetical protein
MIDDDGVFERYLTEKRRNYPTAPLGAPFSKVTAGHVNAIETTLEIFPSIVQLQFLLKQMLYRAQQS